MKRILIIFGQLFSHIFPMSWGHLLDSILSWLYTGFLHKRFAFWGEGSIISWRAYHLKGLEHISVGEQTLLGRHVQLTAWTEFKQQHFNPEIIIGNHCYIREGTHITAIGKIQIGNGLLTGTNVLITDNAHGMANRDALHVCPIERSLSYKGPIVIGDNVWLGNNVCVMGGVSIGQGCIIGANAVVTKEIPPFSVAVGIPAKVIK